MLKNPKKVHTIPEKTCPAQMWKYKASYLQTPLCLGPLSYAREFSRMVWYIFYGVEYAEGY